MRLQHPNNLRSIRFRERFQTGNSLELANDFVRTCDPNVPPARVGGRDFDYCLRHDLAANFASAERGGVDVEVGQSVNHSGEILRAENDAAEEAARRRKWTLVEAVHPDEHA